MTSDDSNNNWSGPGASDSGSGGTPEASPAETNGSSGTADAGAANALGREPEPPAASPSGEPAQRPDAHEANGGYRAGGESERRPEAHHANSGESARRSDAHEADPHYRAGGEPAWRPGPHDADGRYRDGREQHGQGPQGWPPGQPAQGGYSPNAGPYPLYQGGGNYGPPPQGAPYGHQHPGHGHPPGPGGQRPPSPYPAYDYGRPPYAPPPARSNSKSVAALILGIGSIAIPFIGFFLGIVAIIVSSISLKEIRVRGEQGSGMAVAGLVCGIIGTLLYFVIIALIVIFAIIGTSVDNNYDYNNFSNIILDA